MNRRRVLAALAGSGLTGASVWVARNGVPSPGDEDAASGGLPRTVETLDAPGSTAGTAQVPSPDAPTVVDLFATWCARCDEQLAAMRAVRGDYPDVSFVSVTNERVGDTLTRGDLADWWTANGGEWTLGVDPGSGVLAAFGANALPFVAITDADGEIVATHSGVASAATLRERLDTVT
ncbi:MULTISPECIES: TlpA disulfide reductase family protein [Halobacterium]|uniref:TlpA family protein disulfide reductase n=1 Tax=Halobacterium TaxID=2239 RepID=UPI00196249F4|nr:MULTISPECIES: TlpA disulfide reductase family protein [Halobacterium]MCF2166077.1 TlpA family protein disulfide reductase [Halobacterium salinarum]MCF2166829.1 TlpA family protein disulfide reductase [Halobacterium salinarum]MCF2208463.1 TlpA family protein disulfide reductase [Halobacterium salinarum]MCF2237769.1 TlpA family protein disulfide reductase [Halobacterium salinarum]MDL0129105.1 TlpA disulfide reductase family protein [Halobacterium salinarum]